MAEDRMTNSPPEREISLQSQINAVRGDAIAARDHGYIELADRLDAACASLRRLQAIEMAQTVRAISDEMP
jgi:hypothetical protein